MLAVLDANILYSFQLRSLLLHCAVQGVYQPLWSADILEEARRNLIRKGVMTDAQWSSLNAQVEKHFSDALGYGYDGAASGLDLPDEGDRHVVALAVHYEADAIVTWNTKDFPPATLKQVGLTRVRPPTFIKMLWETDQKGVFEAARQDRRSMSKSRPSTEEYLNRLRSSAQIPSFARILEASGFHKNG